MKILQCGYGNIGRILFKNEFLPIVQAVEGELFVYDPNVEECPNKIKDLSGYYDFAFVCVPTESLPDGTADTRIVVDVCRRIDAEIIIIKSTIPITIVSSLPANVIFSPEFTGTTVHSGKHDYCVLGGERKLCNKVAELYKHIHDASFRFYFSDLKTAIIAKYAENCFLATKITFCNEIARACKMANVDYEDVRTIFVADERINPSHTFVYEDQPYYDSHCLNKDVRAFISQFNLPFMKAVKLNRDEQETIFKGNHDE